MSEGSVEEDNLNPAEPTVYTYYGISSCDSEDVRQGDDNSSQLLADSSSVVQAHSDPIFAPLPEFPPEILAKIFIECIPSLECDSPRIDNARMLPHMVRCRLGLVCQVWNAILNDESGVWARLVLTNRLPAQIVSLWIKRSKLHPLDVLLLVDGRNDLMDRDVGVVNMLHRELWRIRSFKVFTGGSINYDHISPLFPPDLLTVAPMMEGLSLRGKSRSRGRLGCIHCPQLRTLNLWNCDKAVESLASQPMQNLRVLTIVDEYGDNMLYTKLLQVLPNLVSLTWSNSDQPLYEEIPRMKLPSLKFLAFRECHWGTMTDLLRHLDVPLLEHLDLENFFGGEISLNKVLDIICGDEAVQLRHLTLGGGTLSGIDFQGIWHHLRHLETLSINDDHAVAVADDLFIPLSPPNRDFSSVCPQLKILELSYMIIKPDALVDFLQRRVKSDLGDPAPGLLTSLTMSNVWVDAAVREMFAQLPKTHSLSVHLPITVGNELDLEFQLL